MPLPHISDFKSSIRQPKPEGFVDGIPFIHLQFVHLLEDIIQY